MPYLSRRAFGVGLSALGFSQFPAPARADEDCSMPIWAVALRTDLERMAVGLTARLKPWAGPENVATPEQFGHQAGDPRAIQAAIDALAAQGGGTVQLTKGDYISSGDDAMCFKGAAEAPTENVLVENCTFYTSCNALKLGKFEFQRVLKGLNLPAEGWLRHVQPRGGAAEMQFFASGDKTGQLAEFQHG